VKTLRYPVTRYLIGMEVGWERKIEKVKQKRIRLSLSTQKRQCFQNTPSKIGLIQIIALKAKRIKL